MISYRARPLATGTGITGQCVLTTLIENTMIVGLFEGEPQTLRNVTAGLNAVLEVLNFKGINEDTFTLECPMTFASRTAGIEIRLKKS